MYILSLIANMSEHPAAVRYLWGIKALQLTIYGFGFENMPRV